MHVPPADLIRGAYDSHDADDVLLGSTTTTPTPTFTNNEFVQVVTTTLFTSPTVIVPPPPPPSTPIPVAAIAGGTVGGVVLAIIAVVAWKWWGQNIMKRELEQRRKKNAARAAVAYRRRFTSEKSAQRTGRSGRPPSNSLKKSTQVSFVPTRGYSVDSTSSVGSEKAVATTPNLPKSEQSPDRIPTPSAPRPLGDKLRSVSERASMMGFGRAPAKSQTYTPFRPSPLAQASSQQSASINSNTPQPSPVPPEPSEKSQNTNEKVKNETVPDLLPRPNPTARPPPTGRRQSSDTGHNRVSNVSSASFYSTPSGEERRPPRKPSLLSFGTSGAQRFSSMTASSGSVYSKTSNLDDPSSRWSWLLAQLPSPKSVVPEGPNRLSAATSSVYSRPEDIPGVPIGVAIGGPEDLVTQDGEQQENAR